MDIYTAKPYIPGNSPLHPGPLARYLPPLLEGMAAAWLEERTGPGDWVLDPFGTSPRLVVEAARTGRRVLVAANNPVARFLIEMAAASPTDAELRAALAELAISRKEGERLETHLQSLYLTECAACQQKIQAEAFLWERQKPQPYGRIYRCPYCSDSGERPATPGDAERATRWANTEALHRARAIERVATLNDPDRMHAEEAVNNYLPRAVYGMGTLINRLDVLDLPAERRRVLTALLLATCDSADSLWPYPSERPRPKQLVIPSRFRENNIWMALEEAVRIWASEHPPVSCRVWPELTDEEGGITIFEGPLRELAPELEKIPLRAVLGALPRPNQAFWTLSALWSGWLWGREAVGPFKSVLRRRRYDWSWHATALGAALGNLSGLPKGLPFLALLTEAEPGFVASALIAAQSAGLELDGIAMRTVHDPVQIHWSISKPGSGTPKPAAPLKVETAVGAYLDLWREPVTYLHAFTAAASALGKAQQLPASEEGVSQVQTAVQQALTATGKFVHYEGSENPETGLWSARLAGTDEDRHPFSDRVEINVVRTMLRNPGSPLRQIEAEINRQFPGLTTPSLALVQVVVDSYGEQQEGGWTLRAEDVPARRRVASRPVGRWRESRRSRSRSRRRAAPRPSRSTPRRGCE